MTNILVSIGHIQFDFVLKMLISVNLLVSTIHYDPCIKYIQIDILHFSAAHKITKLDQFLLQEPSLIHVGHLAFYTLGMMSMELCNTLNCPGTQFSQKIYRGYKINCQ